MALPMRRMTLYKHGVGHFERRGPVSGDSLRLDFPSAAMDDVLKSLVAVDHGPGRVLSIGFETPEDRTAVAARSRIHLTPDGGLAQLLADLRGSRVRLLGTDGSALEGVLVSCDLADGQAVRKSLVSVFLPADASLRALELRLLSAVEVLDEQARTELDHALAVSRGAPDMRSATVVLSPGDHDLMVSYLAPAPAWRVSYRVLANASDPVGASQSETSRALLSAWGIFDNQLEEDLTDVSVTLVAGMPISFRYRLHEPHTPSRPVLGDEERTVEAPPAYDSMAGGPPPMVAMAAPMAARYGGGPVRKLSAMVESSTQVAASGEDRGALFAYEIAEPVSVARGESAMVPVVSQQVPVGRELLYNAAKVPEHPVASLRLVNTTGLTLERGPATVLIAGDYAGEAVLPFTPAGGELLLAYAVELGLTVQQESSESRVLSAIRFAADATVVEEYLQRNTVYRATSALAESATLTIEQGKLAGYELLDTPIPVAQSSTDRRWNLLCPARGAAQLRVTERRLQRRTVEVRTLTGQDIADLLAAGGLTLEGAQGLEEVLVIYRKIDAARAEQGRLRSQIEELGRQQEPIRGNLAALGTDRGEAALRARYVGNLNRIQDQIDAADGRRQELANQIEAWQSELEAQMAELAARNPPPPS